MIRTDEERLAKIEAEGIEQLHTLKVGGKTFTCKCGCKLFVPSKNGVREAFTCLDCTAYYDVPTKECDCGLIACVCVQKAGHAETCRYRRALTCPVAIDCDAHGREVCPECDACDCGGVK